jgi:hypothetical protein
VFNKQFIPTEVTDSLADFILGMDSNAPPILLPKNQAAFLTNTTIKGGFLTDRPPVKRLTISYGGDSTLKSAVEGGLWQGGCFYQPDFGSSSLIASISGRLFKFQIVGDVVTCSEISIPGDLNDATATQSWLWQAEQWMIVQDGKNLPIFYDGVSSRRSYGPETQFNTTSVDWTVPAIGSQVTVTLSAAFAGPYNTPLYVDGFFYQAIENPSGYNVSLTTIYDPSPSTAFAAGDDVMSQPILIGYLTADMFYGGSASIGINGLSRTIGLSTATGVAVNSSLLIAGKIWKVSAINVGGNPNNVTVKNQFVIPGPFNNVTGTLVQYSSSSNPNVLVGETTSPFSAPAIGASIQVTLTLPFNGTPNSIVWINGVQFSISAVPSGAGLNTVTLINLSDTEVGDKRGPTGTAPAPNTGIISSVPELPAGRMGTYGMGRNWMSLVDGQSYIASDIVGGTSGSQAYVFRDSVLKITENDYLAGGGVFRIPGTAGDIRAMIFTATLDSSLGQGALQVFTPTKVFSCNAPVDRLTWQDLTNPIQTQSLVRNGALGHYSTINVNSDTMFRSLDGWRSLILARREFATWPNTPISNEMERIINLDDTTLLGYGSAINFDNRVIYTASPVASPQGVFHQSSLVINNDPLSGMRQKVPSAYDGMWTGLNVLQYMSGLFSGKERAFAFTYNTVSLKLELYEVLPLGSVHFDNGSIPITWSGESPVLFQDVKDKNTLMRLLDGEIRVESLEGRVDFQFFYKPDDYPCWIPWHSWSECYTKPTDSNGLQPGFNPRMGLGEPSSDDCDTNNNRPFREFYYCQVKWIITGHCRVTGMRFKGVTIPQTQFAAPKCNANCST